MSTEIVPKGPVFNYSEGTSNSKANLYFYQFNMPGVNSCLLVGIDGKYKGCIGYPGYAKVSVDPGNKKVSFTPNAPIKISNLDFSYDFEAGQDYFFVYQPVSEKSADDVEIKTQYNMILDISYGWYLVDKEQAIVELQHLRAWHKAI
ncbi:hypothetical protein [Pseudoalteromonas umbrosa]|uniref:hypothetical protein n=1 Tax=Pseudoalteromonas umbrosa TaxID=3048489 RepID=UPI0024C42CB8|nr:hypothetical protein [Pseudoalteromonas sp. B95]MDK1285724.1 hypothetical protein [Pseudoalteromonas sp. B95]